MRAERYVAVKFRVGGSDTMIYAGEDLQRSARGNEEELAELVLHKLIAGYSGKGDEQRRRPIPAGKADSSATAKIDEAEIARRKAENQERMRQAVAEAAAGPKPKLVKVEEDFATDSQIVEIEGQKFRVSARDMAEWAQALEMATMRDAMAKSGRSGSAREAQMMAELEARLIKEMLGDKRTLWEVMYGRVPVKAKPPEEPRKLSGKAYDYRAENSAPKSVRRK